MKLLKEITYTEVIGNDGRSQDYNFRGGTEQDIANHVGHLQTSKHAAGFDRTGSQLTNIRVELYEESPQ